MFTHCTYSTDFAFKRDFELEEKYLKFCFLFRASLFLSRSIFLLFFPATKFGKNKAISPRVLLLLSPRRSCVFLSPPPEGSQVHPWLDNDKNVSSSSLSSSSLFCFPWLFLLFFCLAISRSPKLKRGQRVSNIQIAFGQNGRGVEKVEVFI